MVKEYNEEIIYNMCCLYESLTEKDRRRYAAIEAKKIGHGGTLYISTLFGCDEKTIRQGLIDLDNNMEQEGIRRPGGGRTSKLQSQDNIDEVFLSVLQNHTAGEPMEGKITWTNLTRGEICIEMAKEGIKVSRNIIKKLFKKHGYVKRKALKKQAIGEHKDRDQQFKRIISLREEYEESDNPIISIDAKKKESIGNLYRDGRLECTETIEVLDHDFPDLADAKVTPYAVYDLKNNECFVNVGTSSTPVILPAIL